jgi:hypothetical protein
VEKMSVLDLVKELDVFIHEIKNTTISDSEIENFLRELLYKYKCFHYRTVYRSMYTTVFIFECENYSINLQVDYCECGKVNTAGFQIVGKYAFSRTA